MKADFYFEILLGAFLSVVFSCITMRIKNHFLGKEIRKFFFATFILIPLVLAIFLLTAFFLASQLNLSLKPFAISLVFVYFIILIFHILKIHYLSQRSEVSRLKHGTRSV